MKETIVYHQQSPKIENGNLYYRKNWKKYTEPLSAFAWVYLQSEEVKMGMCCGSYFTEIGRLIMVRKDKSRLIFQYEKMEWAKSVFEALQSASKDILYGYTEENRKLMNA